MAFQHIVDELGRASGAAGFDLCAALRVGDYNSLVPSPFGLEDFGSASNLCIVIGNTRALWPAFLAALARDPALRAEKDPLERYTEASIGASLARIGSQSSVRFSHAKAERRVAIQRLAHAAGLAYLSESHLSVHPLYGPWIALRAAVTFDVPGPAPVAPELAHPCGGCAGHCLPAFERALAAGGGELTPEAARRDWQLWLACRDACPTGREHRYSDAQIRYHYLADRRVLDSRGAVPSP
jgi:methylmalonic aciduria homocystinuria type C protein